jgi:zinc protease
VPALPRTRAPAATAAPLGGLVDLRLANGARILVLPTAGGPGRGGAAAVQLWIGAGTSAERPDEHGCAHLLEHMLFKPLPEGHVPHVEGGRRARGPRRSGGALEAMGGDSNAFTSHDETVVHATVPASAVASP